MYLYLRMNVKGTIRKLRLLLCRASVIRAEWPFPDAKPDFRHPRDINEKIQWLIGSRHSKEWSRYADKIAVREYVSACGYSHLLVPMLGSWKHAADIPWNELPQKFVLKCNHDSGSTVVVDRNAPDFDISAVSSFLERKLRRSFGYVNGEFFYDRIRPRILAEALLPLPEGSASIPDYKVWCFDGRPYCIWACVNRSSGSVEVRTYSTEWVPLPGVDTSTGQYHTLDRPLPPPEHLKEMLEAAAKLSKGFPEVRVDFYEAGGKLYFSEMTFSAYGGKIDFHTPGFLRELGDQCKLPL